MFHEPLILKGPPFFSQFGLSITTLGNLNGDRNGYRGRIRICAKKKDLAAVHKILKTFSPADILVKAKNYILLAKSNFNFALPENGQNGVFQQSFVIYSKTIKFRHCDRSSVRERRRGHRLRLPWRPSRSVPVEASTG